MAAAAKRRPDRPVRTCPGLSANPGAGARRAGLFVGAWRILAGAVAAAGVTLSAGCAAPPTPEAEIRALVREAEIAAEERDAGDLARLISASYGDARGNSRDDVVRMLRLELLRNPSVHLLVRVGDVTLIGDVSATAVVRVAMAGGPLEALEDLATLRADLYRFDLEFVKESGKWRIISASWDRAFSEEFR